MELEQENIDAKIDKKIELWKAKLLDISLRNRLINFKESRLTIKLLPDDVAAFYNSFVNKGIGFNILKSNSSSKTASLRTQLADSETYKRLYKLFLSARESLTEQAVNTLYLSFGFLEYEDADSSERLKAPLILVPARLEKRKSLSKSLQPFTLSFLEDDILINPALRQKILNQRDINIDDDFEGIDDCFSRISDKVAAFGWSLIRDEVFLGVFSFQKLSLYNDLNTHKDMIKKHQVVRALAGGGEARHQVESLNIEDADRTDPKSTFFVLDADSSQQEAVLAARKGASFVLQGPPGTGKSQTIANIIAQLLADGKRVLFVSEKMAALEVVKKRLDSTGIGHYVLEMHNAGTAGKRWILEQLENSLVDNKLYGDAKDLTDQLIESRRLLADYGDELMGDPSDPHPLCRIFGRLAMLEHIKFGDIDSNISTDFNIFRENMRLLEELDMYEDQLKEYNSNILRHINHREIKVFTDLKRERLNEELDAVLELVEHIKEEAKLLSNNANIYFRCAADLKLLNEKLNPLIEMPKTSYQLKEHWFSIDNKRFEELVNGYAVKLDEYSALHSYFASKYAQEFLDMEDFDEVYDRFTGAYSIIVMRWIDPRYKYYMTRFRSQLKENREPTYDEVAHDLRQLKLFRKISNDIAKEKKEISEAIKDENIIVGEILSIISWIKKLKSVEGLFNKELINSISSGYDIKKLAQSFIAHSSKFLDAYFKICEFFEPEAVDRFFKSASWDRIDERFAFIRDHVDSISKWVEFKLTLDKLDKELFRIFEKSMRDENRNYKISELYEKIFFQTYLSRINANLAKRSREFLDLARNKFIISDAEHKFYSRNHIIKMIESQKPKITLTSRSSEVGILRKETAKSRRHKPLRRLFSEIRNLIFVLKPCFMMSPLSVSRFIDPEVLNFDAVIFDEASQIMVEDAISSIIRSRQAIIVGDSKQLPPTMFFKVNEDIDVEEDLEEAESILDEAAAVLGNHMLRWHYRSRDESLISFSNTHFYNGSLITFPNSIKNSFALDLVHVKNGVYDRGGTRQNKNEAKKVVELIKKHFDESPKKSLGVIAFSIAQQQAVIDELDAFIAAHPSYSKYMDGDSLKRFFIKNLETVQGDERDHIIISVGYGRDENGNLSLNFGPLNKDGGAKRLNVAVTRAIEGITLVSSILPEEINESRSSSEGILLLKNYLSYARSKIPLSIKTGKPQNYSDLREAVYRKLNEKGFAVSKSVGSSKFNIDVAISDPSKPDRYALGIELDSTAYSNSRSATDRERIRKEILESIGWKIYRIWSYDWVLNPDKEIERISKLLSLKPDAAVCGSRDEEMHKRNKSVDTGLSFAILDYPGIEYGMRGTPEQFMNYDFFKHAKDIVKNESPIDKKLLMMRVFGCFGVKEGSKSRKRFEEIISAHMPNNEIWECDGVYWAEKPRLFYNVRKGDAALRPAHSIPICELRLAVLLVADNAISISKKDIAKEVANLYGIKRLTPKFKARVNIAVDDLIRKKYLIDGKKITVNKPLKK